MKKIFRKYNNFNTSIFDLIDGKTEVKQTTALGYLLANQDKVLDDFFKQKEIKRLWGNTKINKYSKIIIHTELYSKSRKRADIVIQLYKNNIPEKALIIEAKSISLNISPYDVTKQIDGYLNKEEFEQLKGFELYGCVLTKNNLVLKSNKIASISWNAILKILAENKGLAKEYLNFLTNINGTMNFYEKEVYSIPAGGSYKYQYGYPFIYECPNEGKNYKSIKKPLYFAFRKKGGIMERLFGLDEVIILNPHQDFQMFMENPNYSDEVKQRVKNYCDRLWGKDEYDDNEKQFFILSTSNQIELEHKPKPLSNNAFRAYYKLSELLNKEKEFVETE